jgi:three-Cys-motif partner protein
MEIPSPYRGREQAYFKHCLLGAYLERLFMIVGQRQRTICYVDCFAGPWQSQADDLKDTSIVISLNLINRCREALRKLNSDVQFRALYIEEKPRRFKTLQSYLSTRPTDGTTTQALQGKFHELRQEILDWCGPDSLAFFFIDPTGWKNVVELQTLEPLLKRPNSEVLINFMYDFLSRTVPQPEFQEDMRRIFGVVPDTQGMSPEEREAHLISLYRSNLKQVTPGGRELPRTACVKVQKPTRDRTLYHLVYLTRHPKGIVEFMEASEKLDLVQKKVRALAKQDERVEKKKQLEMFSADEHITDDRVDMDLSGVKAYWLNRLTTEPKRFGTREIADMLEETEWFPGDFQRAFGELERDGQVKNFNAEKKRRSKFVHFDANRDEGELLAKMIP